MPAPVAIYDACVLFPAPVRDLLVHLAILEVVVAKWTDAIHDEWIRSLLETRPDLKRTQLERTRSLMNLNVRDSLVTGYESRMASLTLPDPGDLHVLAAAIECRADVIVTFNLVDFPDASLQPFGIRAVHPDEFVATLLRSDTAAVCKAVHRQRINLKNPPKSVDDVLGTLAQCQLPLTAAALRPFVDAL